MNGNAIRLSTLLGRIFLALIFVVSGAGQLMDPAGTAGYMTSKGMPAPGLLVWGAIAFELLGAAMLIAGWKARAGAVLLILFMIPTTLVFHNFWAVVGNERVAQLLQFLKNTGIIGGLLLVVAYGSGPLSLDAKLRR